MSCRPHIRLRDAALVAAAAVVVLASGHVAGLDTGLLFLAPALLVALPLLRGRYVGERLVTRLAAGRAAPRRRDAAPAAVPRRPAARMPRGGRLVATSLATRPPPAVCA